MKGTIHGIGLLLTAMLVAAAVAAPAALAGKGANQDAFMRAVNARMNELSSPRQAPPDAFERALNAHSQALAARQTSFGERGPDLVERTGGTIFSATSDSGFDWGAAAVGGSAMLGLVLVLSGGAVATRHTRSRAVTR